MLTFPLQEGSSLFATNMFGPLNEESSGPSAKTSLLDTISRPLSLDEYHEERESIRTLKEFYQEYKPRSCSIDSIGLPPGLHEDLAQPEFFQEAFDFAAPQFWQQALDASGESFDIGGQLFDMLFDDGEQEADASVCTFGASEQTFDLGGQLFSADAQTFSGKPLNANARQFNAGEKQLNANAQSFTVSGKPLSADAKPFKVIGKSLNANAQPFDMGGQSFNIGAKQLNADAKPFDMGAQSFDVSGQSDDSIEPFDVSGESFQIQDQCAAFDDDMEWFQPQASWDTVLSTQPDPVLSTQPARSWIA